MLVLRNRGVEVDLIDIEPEWRIRGAGIGRSAGGLAAPVEQSLAKLAKLV